MVMKANPIFDIIALECGYDLSEITRTQASGIAKVAHELKEVGATPEEIKRRCDIYRQKYNGFDLTPFALAKHWAGLKDLPKKDAPSWELKGQALMQKCQELGIPTAGKGERELQDRLRH